MSTTALLIIDTQNDYFPGGRMELPNAESAGEKAGRLLQHFRERNLPVVHIQHESVHDGATFFLPGTAGMDIHASVSPVEGEAVILKHFPNSFRETNLEETLRGLGVEKLVICGMMSNMCVDAGVRAAADLGFECVVAHDACAAANLSFAGVDAPAAQVHAAFMGALAFGYGAVLPCDEIVEG